MTKKTESETHRTYLIDRIKEAVCSSSRRERRRAETKERLFEAAVRLLSQHAFEAVTVEMITEAADVGKGTFFNYFENKEAIISYYFERQFHLLQETLEAASSGSPMTEWPGGAEYAPQEGGPVWRKIVSLVHQSAAREEKSRYFLRTMLALGLNNESVREANVAFRQRIIAVIRALIEGAQRQGEFREDVDAEVLAEFMFSTHLGALYTWCQSDAEETLHAAIDRAFCRVWSGIRHHAFQETSLNSSH